MAADLLRWFEFGPFRVDIQARVLWRDRQLVALPLKALDTLIALARCPGEVVLKVDLMKEVWPDTFVQETGLTHNIAVLRRILGEWGAMIETIPKRGYRIAVSAGSPAPVGQLPASANREWLPAEAIDLTLGWCERCDRHLWLASPEEAAEALATTVRDVYRWMESGGVHYTESNGRVTLCMPSLLQHVTV